MATGQGTQYGFDGNAVTQQPGHDQQSQQTWMAAPVAPAGCPPGLEYLTQIDQILVHQQVELIEIFTGCEMKNKYRVCNSLNQQVYFATEETDCCTRQCCGPARPFDMSIVDNYQREVIHLSRPLRCQSCCFPCCLQMLEVQAPLGTVIGTIEQQWTLWKPNFAIKDANGETLLTIDGPCCPCACCSDVMFEVKSADRSTNVGQITKQWSGMIKEMFTDTDNFGISFPMDLNVKAKATLLGACFLIDFMFFEQNQN